ncbi:MAG TPA: hypothetical protein VLZ56_05795 [Mycoplana sp.]|nr:hypothetical protein [Mycoplana sp.]
MTRYDYLCMTCCYGLVGALGWTLVTGDLLPTFAAVFATGATLLVGALRGEP